MSYILDALKKIEHEKERKARKAGMTGISGELFRDVRPQSGRGGPGKTIALVIVTALLAIGVTWYFLRPAGKQRDMKPPPALTTPPPVVVPPPPAALLRPAAPPQSPLPAAQQPVAAKPRLQAPGRIPPIAAAPVTPPGGRGAEEQRQLRQRPPVSPAPNQAPAATEPGLSPDIRVSGIAWQDDRTARRAVINGFLMKEGGFVAGARIVEILQDRVRFSQAGRDFELALVVSGAGAPAK